VDVSLKYEKGEGEKMGNIRKKYSGAFKAKGNKGVKRE